MNLLRKLFGFVLNPLESGSDPYVYKASHRTILFAVSIMFIGLASLVYWLSPDGGFDYFLPVVVFGGAGVIGIVVASLGNERAVAKIWGSK